MDEIRFALFAYSQDVAKKQNFGAECVPHCRNPPGFSSRRCRRSQRSRRVPWLHCNEHQDQSQWPVC